MNKKRARKLALTIVVLLLRWLYWYKKEKEIRDIISKETETALSL